MVYLSLDEGCKGRVNGNGVITVSKDSSGSKDFIREVTKEYRLKAIIKPKGQPKKDEKENK